MKMQLLWNLNDQMHLWGRVSESKTLKTNHEHHSQDLDTRKSCLKGATINQTISHQLNVLIMRETVREDKQSKKAKRFNEEEINKHGTSWSRHHAHARREKREIHRIKPTHVGLYLKRVYWQCTYRGVVTDMQRC